MSGIRQAFLFDLPVLAGDMASIGSYSNGLFFSFLALGTLAVCHHAWDLFAATGSRADSLLTDLFGSSGLVKLGQGCRVLLQ